MCEGMITSMNSTDVTIAVIQRERFSLTEVSLNSLYENTDLPFKMVYIDGASPRATSQYLQEQSKERGFELIRVNKFLQPNQARNIAFRHAQTPYIAFVENDCLFRPGWLTKLLECARETGAEIVTPVITEGSNPAFETVHCIGGATVIFEEEVQGVTKKGIRDEIHYKKHRIADALSEVTRYETGLTEFHCVLVKTDLLHRLGGLDEGMINTKEHLDFSLAAKHAHARLFVEPESVVNYVGDLPLKINELPFYFFRWNTHFARQSMLNLCKKWGLDPETEFVKRRSDLSWRRKYQLAQFFTYKVTGNSKALAAVRKAISPFDKLIDQLVYLRNRKSMSNRNEAFEQLDLLN